MKNFINSIVFIFCVTGCATVFNGTTERISVNSTVQDAEITINGSFKGKTPAIIDVDRQVGNDVAQVKKEGYNQGSFQVKKTISPGWLIWDLGTCIFPITLCIPLVIDGITGSWMNVETSYVVLLNKKEETIKQSEFATETKVDE